MAKNGGGRSQTGTPARNTKPHSRQDNRLIRFESSSGEGLFAVASLFNDLFESRSIRLNRKVEREVHNLLQRLRELTPTPDSGAYRDALSRRPVTWFRASASELLRSAERLVEILNQFGADIRRYEAECPLSILWQDEVQVVTRRPRRPAARAQTVDVLSSRRRDRRKKLERRRARAARCVIRRSKSGL